MANTKQVITCTHGKLLGEVIEFELNESPQEIEGIEMIIKDKKIFYHNGKQEEELRANLPMIEHFKLGTYLLLKSDLSTYEQDYKGWVQFKGTKELAAKQADKETIERINKSLTEFQKQTISSIAQNTEKYISEYIKNPLKIIQKQNEIMSKQWESLPQRVFINRQEIEDRQEIDTITIVESEIKPETSMFEELVRLNAMIEKEILNKNYEKEHTLENTIELRSTDYIAEGDYSPAEEAKIGQKIQENNRGNLVIHKTSSSILDLLAEAKIIASKPQATPLKTAIHVYRLLQDKYSGKQAFVGRANETNSLAEFMQNGGTCINKALTLQLALQEAGIPSRFVRGKSGGKHAWVEADVLDEGKYTLVLDPQKYGGMINTKGNDFTKRLYKYEDYYGKKLGHFNVIWRSK